MSPETICERPETIYARLFLSPLLLLLDVSIVASLALLNLLYLHGPFLIR